MNPCRTAARVVKFMIKYLFDQTGAFIALLTEYKNILKHNQYLEFPVIEASRSCSKTL